MQEANTPEFKHEFRSMVLGDLDQHLNLGEEDEMHALDDDELPQLTPDAEIANSKEFVKSDIFVKECRQHYARAVHEGLANKEVYKLVDALEDTMDFWNYGKHISDIPIANSYIPVRNTIMKKPNMLD